MIISRYLQYVVQGGWLEPLFFDKLIMGENYKKFADYRYYDPISILNEIFGEDNVCFLLQEEIVTEPSYVQNNLKAFMGTDLDFESVNRRKNIETHLRDSTYSAVNTLR